jgi:hypothetical protein
VHQRPDTDRGLAERRRVARGPAAALTFDGDGLDRLWLAEPTGTRRHTRLRYRRGGDAWTRELLRPETTASSAPTGDLRSTG